MTDRSFERANDESRERLARLAVTLTPNRLAVDLGGGWTVASALAHMAFWDRWQAERWRAVLEGEWLADDRSVITSEHLANIGLDPILMRVESDGLPAEAVQAAEVIDRLIASAPDATSSGSREVSAPTSCTAIATAASISTRLSTRWPRPPAPTSRSIVRTSSATTLAGRGFESSSVA